MKEYISIIISIVSLTVSIITLIYSLITNSKRVSLLINYYTCIRIEKGNYYDFDVIISNESRIPISINSIEMVYGKEKYKFIKSPRNIITNKDIKTNVERKVNSDLFPITINSSSSKHCFISVYGPETINKEKVVFNIYTNRGLLKSKIELNNYYVEPEEFANEVMHYLN